MEANRISISVDYHLMIFIILNVQKDDHKEWESLRSEAKLGRLNGIIQVSIDVEESEVKFNIHVRVRARILRIIGIF